MKILNAGIAALGLGLLGSAQAQSTLNLYSARHYPTDEALYSEFTKSTGITIRRVDADDAGILTRLKTEGAASPADVILLVDAARLWRAEADGLFLPVHSAALESVIPTQFRAQPNAEGGIAWFGMSTRARIVVFDKRKLDRQAVDSYEKLADPKLKGLLCIRSGSHPYNLSLFGALHEHMGAGATERWLKGQQVTLVPFRHDAPPEAEVMIIDVPVGGPGKVVRYALTKGELTITP